MPQPAVPAPFREFNLRDQHRLDPVGIARIGTRHIDERRGIAAERARLCQQITARPRRVACADAAGISELAVVVVADQEGTDVTR